MNSKKRSLGPFGQRSISSTFLFRASDQSSDCGKRDEIKASSQKSSHLTLSDFLNNKLHKSSVLSSLPAKALPFSLPVSGEDSIKSAQSKVSGGEVEAKFSIDCALHLFKNVEKGKNDSDECTAGHRAHVIYDKELRKTRKRKNLLEDQEDKPPVQKRMVVLGEDSNPTSRKRVTGKGPQPLFNHYENGGGWWDDSREGVDNEELGCCDVWEGVNCTTLGGIEWH